MDLDIDIRNLSVNDLDSQLPMLAKGLKEGTVGVYHGHLVSKEGGSRFASPTYRQLDIVVQKAEKLLQNRSSDRAKQSLREIKSYADESRGTYNEKGKIAQFFESLANVIGTTFK